MVLVGKFMFGGIGGRGIFRTTVCVIGFGTMFLSGVELSIGGGNGCTSSSPLTHFLNIFTSDSCVDREVSSGLFLGWSGFTKTLHKKQVFTYGGNYFGKISFLR